MLSSIALALPLATVALILLGYGYELGHKGLFGIKIEDFGRTPVDYLAASNEVVRRVLQWLASFIKLEMQLSLLQHIWIDLWWVGLVAAAATAFLSWIVLGTAKTDVSALLHILSRVSRLRRVGRAALGVAEKVLIGGRQAGAYIWRRRVGLSGWLGLPALIGFFFAIAWSAWLLIAVPTIAIVALPLVGALIGEKAARIEIVQPQRCRTAEALDGAECVRLVKDQSEIARGRYIAESKGRVFLYDPSKPGQYKSVPLDGVKLEPVESL